MRSPFGQWGKETVNTSQYYENGDIRRQNMNIQD